VSRLRSALVIMAFAAVFASACDSTRSVIPEEFVPVADSPAGAVQRLAWGFNGRSLDIVGGVLADDFVMQSASVDSAGNGTRDVSSDRDSLLAELRLLFQGGPGVPRAGNLQLTFDRNVVPFDDTRPGKNAKWHKTVRTAVSLLVVDSTTQQRSETTGHALFFLVRGDSTQIPPDEVAHGARPDSTRWWIERWEDESIGGGGAAHSDGAARP